MENFWKHLFLMAATVCTVICGDIYRPCKSNSMGCVKKYFNENARCNVVDKPKDDVYYEENIPFYLPVANLTVMGLRTYLRNLEGDVEDFYEDKQYGNLVMAVKFKGVSCSAPGAIWAIDQKAKPPILFREFVNATYPVTITAIIPARDGISDESLANAFYYGYFASADAKIVAGPKFKNSSDPEVRAAHNEFLKHIPIALQEIFYTKAQYTFVAYLQNHICDFGLPPVPKKYSEEALSNQLNCGDDCDNGAEEPKGDLKKQVTSYFKENGHCSLISETDDKPLKRGETIVGVPDLNCTLRLKGSYVSGLKAGKILSFNVNEKSNNAILSIEFDKLVVDAPVTEVIIFEPGQEPITITGHNSGSYSVIFTAMIPISNGLTAEAMKKTFVTPYFTQPSDLQVGQNIAQSKDPRVIAWSKQLEKDPRVVVREIFVNAGYNLFLAYIQNYICDFNIPLYN